PPALRAEAVVDHAAGELDPMAGARGQTAEGVIVRERVGDGLEAAEGGENRPPDQDARAHSERNAFQLAGDEDRRLEVGRETERVHPAGEARRPRPGEARPDAD